MKHRILGLAVSLGIPIAIGYSQPTNQNPGLAWQGPDHYSFTVGEVKITALSDGTVPQDLHVLRHNTTNEKTDALLERGLGWQR